MGMSTQGPRLLEESDLVLSLETMRRDNSMSDRFRDNPATSPPVDRGQRSAAEARRLLNSAEPLPPRLEQLIREVTRAHPAVSREEALEHLLAMGA